MPRPRGSKPKSPQQRAVQAAAVEVLVEQGMSVTEACRAVGLARTDFYTAWDRLDTQGFQASYEQLKNALARAWTVIYSMAAKRLMDKLADPEAKFSGMELNNILGTSHDKLALLAGSPTSIVGSAGDRRAAVEELYSHMTELGLVARRPESQPLQEEPERPN